MATALRFKRQEISGDYIITLRLPYLPYIKSKIAGIYIPDEISVFWKKDLNGVYNLSIIYADKEAIWNPFQAGLASTYRLLNETINNALKIKIIQTDDFSEIQRKEYIASLGNTKRKALFYKDYLYDEDIDTEEKFVDCNNLKLYFFEKILTETDDDVITKIGKGELFINRINVSLIRNQTKKPFTDKKTGEPKLRTVTSNTTDFQIEYKIDFVKSNSIRCFFQSIEENGEKQIAVLYNTGFDCAETKQRIKKFNPKNQQTYIDVEDRKEVFFCSDWYVVTIGKYNIMRDMGNSVDGLLASYFNVSIKFIRFQSFEALWEMCRGSS